MKRYKKLIEGPNFKKGDRVTLTKAIKQLNKDEWDMSSSQYRDMLNHIGYPGTVMTVSPKGYVYITFDDDYTLPAVAIDGNDPGTYQVVKTKN